MGIDAVAVEENSNVQLPRADFTFAKAAHKPTAMTLHLVDRLFTREVFSTSTVHGTKEHAPLDQDILAAVKG